MEVSAEGCKYMPATAKLVTTSILTRISKTEDEVSTTTQKIFWPSNSLG